MHVDYVLGGSFEWLAPGREHVMFIEPWWPSSVTPNQARLWISPPSGAAVNVTPGMANPPNGSWWARIKKVGAYTKALLVVHPTAGPVKTFAAGLHGRWKIRIDPTASGPPGSIHAYVARADHNMGARRRSKASRLSDPGLEAARFVAPADRYKEAPNSAIQRQDFERYRDRAEHSCRWRLSLPPDGVFSSSGRSQVRGRADACITDDRSSGNSRFGRPLGNDSGIGRDKYSLTAVVQSPRHQHGRSLADTTDTRPSADWRRLPQAGSGPDSIVAARDSRCASCRGVSSSEPAVAVLVLLPAPARARIVAPHLRHRADRA
jgi:hypothetical protein